MNRNATLLFTLSLVSLLCSAPRLAQAEDFAPDRPGLSTGTHTVSPGTFYLESGYQLTFSRSGLDTATQTLPQMVLRTGVTNSIELDLLWDGWNRTRIQGQKAQTSSSDINLGGKYRLITDERYNITLMALVNLATGTPPSSTDSNDPFVGILWDYQLNEQSKLFGVLQSTRVRSDSGKHMMENEIGLGIETAQSTKLSIFLELFATLPSDATSNQQYFIDGGMTYLYHPDIQLDLSIGIGLNENSSHFISVGYAARF